MKKSMQQGFTLIELMIVVAIIGILAAVAIPQYQNYTAKTKATSAVAELAPGRTAYEIHLNEGKPLLTAGKTDETLNSIGLKAADTAHCDMEIIGTDVATTGIQCNLVDAPAALRAELGETVPFIKVTRGTEADWKCKTNITSNKFYPAGCTLEVAPS